jgi:uncharacterized protein
MAKTGEATAPGPKSSGQGHVKRTAGQPRKHTPLRTCVACREMRGKRDLIRIVRTPASGVRVDPTGKLTGRGAYLCRKRACWERGLRTQSLSQALKTTLTSEEVAALRAFAATLPGSDLEEAGIGQ